MGLFSKKECAVCGGCAGLLTRYVLADGEFICSDCRHRLSSNLDRLDDLTLEEVKEQIRLKEENNARYRNEFVISRRFDLDSNHPVIAVDDTHGWFALLKDQDPDIFAFEQITSYNVALDTEAMTAEEKASGMMELSRYLGSDMFYSRYPDMPRCLYGNKITGMHFDIGLGPNPFRATLVRLEILPDRKLTKDLIEKAYMCGTDIYQCIKDYMVGWRSGERA